MKLANSEEDLASTGHLLSLNEVCSTTIGLHIIGFWSKVFYGNPQTTQAVAKAINSSPQTDSKAPMLKTYTPYWIS